MDILKEIATGIKARMDPAHVWFKRCEVKQAEMEFEDGYSNNYNCVRLLDQFDGRIGLLGQHTLRLLIVLSFPINGKSELYVDLRIAERVIEDLETCKLIDGVADRLTQLLLKVLRT